MTGAIVTATGNFHTAMANPTAFFVLAWAFPIHANFVSVKMLDGRRASDLNIVPDHRIDKVLELERQNSIEENKTAPQTIEVAEDKWVGQD